MTKPGSKQLSFIDVAAEPGVHEILDLRSTFGFCAFHGGNLERLTDQIASEAAARSGASFYGMLQPKGMRNHVPSALVGAHPTPKLSSFLDHCDVVVAIHGYGLKVVGPTYSLAARTGHSPSMSLDRYGTIFLSTTSLTMSRRSRSGFEVCTRTTHATFRLKVGYR